MNHTWRVMPNPDSDKLYDVVPGLSGHPIYPVDGYTAIASSLTIYQALLIAAAPDLLDALEEIVNNAVVNYEGSMDIYSEAVDAARAAIRKAKGGGDE